MNLSRGKPDEKAFNWEDMELPSHYKPIDLDLEEKLNSDEFKESMLSWAVSGTYDYTKWGRAIK